MPIYEFYSPDTHRIYSFFARSLSESSRIPRCPDDAGARMERMISSFAVTGRAREGTAPEGGDDPRMERVMAEMEREMSSISDENPDPRQLGRLMRKMSDAMGEKMPEAMEQMIARLEKGEDPEKLEAEFGDALEDFGGNLGDEPAGRPGGQKRRLAPTRDPQLYEMRDYL